jgi:hypothetical protein
VVVKIKVTHRRHVAARKIVKAAGRRILPYRQGMMAGIQVNSYETNLFWFISISRKTETAGIAVQ